MATSRSCRSHPARLTSMRPTSTSAPAPLCCDRRRCAACAAAPDERHPCRCRERRLRARGLGERRRRRPVLVRDASGRRSRPDAGPARQHADLADDGAPFFLNGVAGLGSPFWNPDFESRFVGEGSELQQCRAVLESVAFLIKANLDEMDRHLDSAPARLVASGGLAENRLLCRMLACLAGVPVDRGERSRGDIARPRVPGRREPAGFEPLAIERLRARARPEPAGSLSQVDRADAEAATRA